MLHGREGNRKRKYFSGTTKQEANKKITACIANFENQAEESDKSRKLLKDSIQNWLEIFKFPTVEQTTYDRCECTTQNQIYPILGDKEVGDVTAADIKNLLTHYMNKGLAYSTVKKVYVLLNEYFRTMYLEELISKNPIENVEMIKKVNFLSAQGKENLPECETITILDSDELKRFKEEVYSTYSNGVRKHQQAAAYILMLNTGMRLSEALGLKTVI